MACAVVLGQAAWASVTFGQSSPAIETHEYLVPHVSTAPATLGQHVELYVRERVLAEEDASLPGTGRAVLFVHGATYPSAYGFDLPFKDYSWMAYLAAAGFDAFGMDMTGYGRSTRPEPMNDPCNATEQQQRQFLVPSMMAAPCAPSYPYILTTRPSQWDDVDVVVEYIRELRSVERVSLIGWSGGGPRMAGYAALYPDKVESVVLLAPGYNRNNPTDPPPEALEAGLPMNIGSPLDRDLGVISPTEAACGNSYEPGLHDAIRARNSEFDPTGAAWGLGVVRAPTTAGWGWNALLAAQIQAPTLLISGEYDDVVAPQAVRDLYEDVGTPHKVFLELACTGHKAQFQARYKIVQGASLDWLLYGSVDGVKEGSIRKGD
jgi:pimeloyl-ACP methyl ester carboxylesterase